MNLFKFSSLALSIFLTGCVTMDLKPGMNLNKVNSEFYVFCNNGKVSDKDHVVYIGPFSLDETIDVYRSNPKTIYPINQMSSPELCIRDLYFKNGILLSDSVIDEIKNAVLLKQEIMISIIVKNKLKVLDKFSKLSDKEFKIYTGPDNSFFYSINYEFVDRDIVSGFIYKHEQEVKTVEQRRIREIERQRIDVKQKQENQAKTRQIHQDFDAKKINHRIDLISQVLNFSNGTPDNGSQTEFWERSQEGQCIYLLHSRYSHNPIKSININELDPNSIRFEYESFGSGVVGTVIYANDKVILSAWKRLDFNRLHNGWRKVFQSDCKGIKRAF
jgi:hypothetical protein